MTGIFWQRFHSIIVEKKKCLVKNQCPFLTSEQVVDGCRYETGDPVHNVMCFRYTYINTEFTGDTADAEYDGRGLVLLIQTDN